MIALAAAGQVFIDIALPVFDRAVQAVLPCDKIAQDLHAPALNHHNAVARGKPLFFSALQADIRHAERDRKKHGLMPRQNLFARPIRADGAAQGGNIVLKYNLIGAHDGQMKRFHRAISGHISLISPMKKNCSSGISSHFPSKMARQEAIVRARGT